MLERVISGGQTGVDQAALRAAKACGIPTGGFAPKGWQTETGPAPWLADYGLTQCPDSGYDARTKANVLAADATLVLTRDTIDRGTYLTSTLCTTYVKPFLTVNVGQTRPATVAFWLRDQEVGILNIAGPRESSCPGIGEMAETFFREVLRGRLR
jgi:hypothetical protein